jgi:hypothetical protein
MTAERWVAIGSTIIIPLTIALVGACVSSAIQESQKRVRYLELAISVLKTPPSTDTENLRSWAIRVMKKYSEVSISEDHGARIEDEENSTFRYFIA